VNASRRRLALAALFAGLHAALSLLVLARGYPHEDAYILFKYSRNVAAGFGIVFYPGGPHAEGATDFLWMLALAAFAKLGIDPAIAALLLNALGFGFAMHRIQLLLEGEGSLPVARAVACGGGLLLVLHAFAVAGALGFSATVYGALALELFRRLTRGEATNDSRVVPWLALLLGLVRPDGVVLGGAATFVALARAKKSGASRPVLIATLGCSVIGALYFALRAWYFGQLLPLPLVVKRNFEGLPPGIESVADWCVSTLLPMLGAMVVLRSICGRAAWPSRAWLIALVPFAIHVLSFMPSVPSQNVANRFHSPAALVVFVTVLAALVRCLETARAKALGVPLALPIAFYPQGLVSVRALREALDPDYVNPFSARLAVIERDRVRAGRPPLKIASTEAGRILYWTNGPVLDLVGLNTAELATRPPSWADLDRFDADVVMIHPAGTMHEDAIERGAAHADVFPVEPPFWRYVFPWNARLLVAEPVPYAISRVENIRAAPVATVSHWDSRAGRYDFYAARFAARFARLHLYAIKKGLPEKEAIVRELVRAHDVANHGSHLRAMGIVL